MCERVIGTITEALGPIDVLVHNAGGDIAAAGGKPDPNDAIMVKEDDVRAVLDRNLLSTIFVCQVMARQMMQRRRGRIVTISSTGAYGGRANGAIYATAKAAAIQYTRCLAAQLRPVQCHRQQHRAGRHAHRRASSTRGEVDPARLVEGGTLERVALVDEVARAVEVFAGPTGDFITGQVLRVDGGGAVLAGVTSGLVPNAAKVRAVGTSRLDWLGGWGPCLGYPQTERREDGPGTAHGRWVVARGDCGSGPDRADAVGEARDGAAGGPAAGDMVGNSQDSAPGRESHAAR